MANAIKSTSPAAEPARMSTDDQVWAAVRGASGPAVTLNRLLYFN